MYLAPDKLIQLSIFGRLNNELKDMGWSEISFYNVGI